MTVAAPFPPGSKVLLYCRDSGSAEQELSIPQQEQYFRSWCIENSYQVTRIFKDAARPGSTTTGRAALEEMLSYLRRGGAGERGVIIWKFSRLAREYDQATFMVADIRRHGYEVFSLQDRVPPGPEGRLFEAIIHYSNQ